MKKAGMHFGPGEGDGQMGLLHHPSEQYVRHSLESVAAGLGLFEALARSRWVMKNAPLARLPVNVWPS
jgi:hypothetical protein